MRGLGVRYWVREDEDPVTIRSLVNFVMSSEDDLDSRIEPRVPALLMGEVHDGSQAQDTQIRNLSVGGAFLELESALNPTAELQVTIAMEDEKVVAKGRVAFQIDPESERPEGVPAGAGVAFVDLDLVSQAVVRRFLAELLGRYQL